MAFMTKEEYEAYVKEHTHSVVSGEEIAYIRTALRPLIGDSLIYYPYPKRFYWRLSRLRLEQ